MALVKAFRGIRYNPELIDDFSSVVAPPYDIIDDSLREDLYRRHPYNIVRLILAKGENEERYSKAASLFEQWLREKVLIQDDLPSIYPYYQEFEFEGERFTRKGFVATVKIEDFDSKVVLPHERTFSKHKEDRLKLMQACKANLSQVFAVFSDEEGISERLIDSSIGEPILDIVACDGDGVRNVLWKISDPEVVSQVAEVLKDKSLLIADGHHRYETALNYRNMMRAKEGIYGREKPYDYVMMYLARGEGEGLIINPTHRVIKKLEGVSEEAFVEELRKYFHLERTADFAKLDFNQMIVVIGGVGEPKVFKLTPKQVQPKRYENMAVMLLHNIVLKQIVSEDSTEILYTKSKDELVELVKSGKFKAGFILPKLKASDIFEVVENQEKMPHKTTYFYPKLLSGLVINPLW